MKIMRIKIFLFFACFGPFMACSQSAWDIGFIFVDSICNSDIGKEVKIDFISANTLSRSRHPINFLGREDTAVVVLCGFDTVRFIEKRSIRADWGLYDDQYLESDDYLSDKKIKLRTTKFVIQDIQKDSIYFHLYSTIYRIKGKKETHLGNKIFSVWILKDKLYGVMFKLKE